VSHSDVVKEYIVNEFLPDVSPSDLTDDYELIATGVIDSLGVLRLISWLETRFDIPVDDIDISELDFVTVNAISQFIDRTARPVADDIAKAG
jgi:acyl carrier protein